MSAYLGGSAAGQQPATLFSLAPRLSLMEWKKIWAQLLETGAHCQDTEFISSEKVLFPVCLHFSVLERQKEKTALVYVENKYRKNRYQDFLRLSAQPEVEGFWEFDFVRKRYTLGGACLGLLGLEGTFQTLDKETLERLLKKKVTAECFSRLKQNVEQAFKEGTPFELKLEFRPPAENRDYVLACEAEQSELSTTRLLARAIYQLSNREQAPLIKVNCAALPRSLIESELFGHEKGAFTGAAQQRKGRFEVAHRGTIFLDEIGEMPLSLQPKLLRVLQDGEFERVGGNKTLKVDVRVIAATNRNLQEMVERGEFREDLYYRLNVFPIYNIPLRERPEDIPVLVRHFVKKYCQQSGKTIGKIAQADINLLLRYDFPGNVRELENLIERAVILTRGNKLNVKDSFAPAQKKNKLNNDSLLSFEDMQREHIIKALERTKWRVTGPRGAARLLGLKDRTLMSKMRRLSIRREDFD
ncbi:MAG: sigma 54-interacting transcriptional regulator [Lewinellaceae bacterium]|nr:sigma 54-interacting transcriptional regulator [Lewinellaceae bacterium]